MNIPRTIARYAVFGSLLAFPAMLVHAQETKPAETKKKNSEGNKSERPARTEHTAPASGSGQHASPAQQRRDTSQPERVRPTPPVQSRPSTPAPASKEPLAPTPRTREARPDSAAPNRGNGPATPGAQPGRTFGNTAPNRGAEPRVAEPRGPAPMGTRPAGPANRTFTTRSGDVIHRDASGQVRQVRMSNGTVVYHPPNAPRRIEVVRPGGRVVVASAPGHGYVQRPIVINNTTIIKRTYIYNGVPQARIYRPRVFNGVTLAIYTPVRYYRPAFYVYAYNPWPRPIVFAWGWGGSPWYGYYGGYFTPYPVYASPSLWLTDYLIAATLENAYQERMAAQQAASAGNMYAAGGQSAPMTPEVKQAIADEVHRQIDRERASGQNGTNGQDTNIFADNGPHVFVASATLMVNSNAGDCTIAEGDVLQMNGAPPMNSTSANLMVLSSRGQDCRKGSQVSVGLQDLQEMQNQMQATIDRGMGDLQSKQGQGGLPPLPQGSAGTIDSPYAQAAQPDTNVASELTSVTQEADRAEQQAVSQSGEGGSAAPPTLSLGLSIEDVKSIQGEPQKIVDLGAKKIYVYKDLKITFTDGKVSDIQ